MANSVTTLLTTLASGETDSVSMDITRIATLLEADEVVRAVAAGTTPNGEALLVVATAARVLTIDQSIPLGRITSIATSGTVRGGAAVTISGEHDTIRATNIAFSQAQRFVAAVRAGVARAEVAAPTWLPTQRLAVDSTPAPELA